MTRCPQPKKPDARQSTASRGDNMANAELIMDMDFSAVIGYSDAEAQARLNAVTVDKASYAVLNAGVWDATYHSNHKTVNLYVTWSNTSYTQAQLEQAYYDC